eukprot:scaffold8459_cov267-Pinguiococcus_pyrenoidosus.AAC.2
MPSRREISEKALQSPSPPRCSCLFAPVSRSRSPRTIEFPLRGYDTSPMCLCTASCNASAAQSPKSTSLGAVQTARKPLGEGIGPCRASGRGPEVPDVALAASRTARKSPLSLYIVVTSQDAKLCAVTDGRRVAEMVLFLCFVPLRPKTRDFPSELLLSAMLTDYQKWERFDEDAAAAQTDAQDAAEAVERAANKRLQTTTETLKVILKLLLFAQIHTFFFLGFRTSDPSVFFLRLSVNQGYVQQLKDGKQQLESQARAAELRSKSKRRPRQSAAVPTPEDSSRKLGVMERSRVATEALLCSFERATELLEDDPGAAKQLLLNGKSHIETVVDGMEDLESDADMLQVSCVVLEKAERMQAFPEDKRRFVAGALPHLRPPGKAGAPTWRGGGVRRRMQRGHPAAEPITCT